MNKLKISCHNNKFCSPDFCNRYLLCLKDKMLGSYLDADLERKRLFRKTLDIDLTSKWSNLKPKDEMFIENIIEKISKCKHFLDLKIKSSMFKGFHITLFCSINCDICRLCYDDDKRLAYDLNRPEYARDILFSYKEKVKIK